MRRPAEAGAYLRALRAILQYLGICDGNMEEGSFRCDANVSVRPRGQRRARHQGRDQEHELLPRRRARHRVRDRAPGARRSSAASGSCRRRGSGTPTARRPARCAEGVGARLPLLPRARPAAARGRPSRGSTRCGARCPSCPPRAARRFEREHGLSGVRRRRAHAAQGRRRLLRGRRRRAAATPKEIGNWVTSEVLRIVREEKLDDALVIRDWPVTPAQLGDARRAGRRGDDQPQHRQGPAAPTAPHAAPIPRRSSPPRGSPR